MLAEHAQNEMREAKQIAKLAATGEKRDLSRRRWNVGHGGISTSLVFLLAGVVLFSLVKGAVK